MHQYLSKQRWGPSESGQGRLCRSSYGIYKERVIPPAIAFPRLLCVPARFTTIDSTFMDEILHQLGNLFLGSVPTMILFLLLVFCYTVLVDHPLRRTLAERRERTAGAQEKARAAVALAEEKARHYQNQLQLARVEILQSREKQVAGWNAARENAVNEAREAAQTRVREARAAVQADAERSRASLDPAIDSLAGEILATVLPAEARS